MRLLAAAKSLRLEPAQLPPKSSIVCRRRFTFAKSRSCAARFTSMKLAPRWRASLSSALELSIIENMRWFELPSLGPPRNRRGPAPIFRGTPAKAGGPAPTLGQHTDEILTELGMGDEIATLREMAVVA